MKSHRVQLKALVSFSCFHKCHFGLRVCPATKHAATFEEAVVMSSSIPLTASALASLKHADWLLMNTVLPSAKLHVLVNSEYGAHVNRNITLETTVIHQCYLLVTTLCLV